MASKRAKGQSYNQIQSRLEFNYHVHNYLSNHILIADAKSGFTSVVVLAFLALINQEFIQDNTNNWLFCLGIIFLILALLACLLTIFPRFFWIKKGFVSAEDILAWPSPGSYIKEFSKLNTNELVDVITRENYELSTVVRRKYTWFRRAIYFLLASLPLLVISRSL